jgi:hypothetical protein
MPARQPGKVKVPIHARVDSVDVAELDAGADEQLITRSQVVAQIIREWADRRRRKTGRPDGGGKKRAERE